MRRSTGGLQSTLLALSLCMSCFDGPGDALAQVSSLSNARQRRTYIVVAHQDDWQLFMGDIVVQTLMTETPVTFIYLTAGDDGQDSSYWQTRERAALASTRVATGLPAVRSDSLNCQSVPIVSHAIRKCVLGETDSYFLRLPDGRRNGAGFKRYGNQSMRRLRLRKIASLTTVDGSANYQSWDDLAWTVSSLIDTTAVTRVVVHTMDPSVAVNPHDHFDHRLAGLLVSDLKKRRDLSIRYYVGYALSTRAANRSNAQAQQKTSVFMAYDNEMMRSNRDWSAYREHPTFYSNCMLRTYARSPRAR